MDNLINRTASDYISMLKTRQLKNYKVILSSGNTAAPSYDIYLLQKSLKTVLDSSCSTTEPVLEMNGIAINPVGRNCIYPENTFDGIVHVCEPTYIPNTSHGLYWKACTGSFDTDSNYFLTADSVPDYTSSGIAPDIRDLSFGTNGVFWASDPDAINPSTNYPFCVEWTGYFYCTKSGTWDFSLIVKERDNAFFWIGPYASSGYTQGNSNMSIYNDNTSGDKTIYCSFTMIKGQYYPIRIQYDEKGYDQGLTFNFRAPNTENFITDGSQNLFYTNDVLITPEYLPLKSTPSISAKLQQPCYKGIKSCETLLTNPYRINKYRIQWNRKKSENMKITDSTTFRM